MPISDKIESIKKHLESFLNYDLGNLSVEGQSVQVHPNYSQKELKTLVDDAVRIVKKLKENTEYLESLNYTYANNLNNQLNNFIAQYQAVEKLQPNQLRNQHHNAVNQLEAVMNTLRQSGVYSVLSPSFNIQEAEDDLNELRGKADIVVKEAEDNAKIIQDLIPEATATSLSTTLGRRTQQLERRVNIWFGIVIFVLIGSSVFSWAYLTNQSKKEINTLENLVDQQTKNSHLTLPILDSLGVNINQSKDSLTNIDQTELNHNRTIQQSGGHSEKEVNSESDWAYWVKRVIIFLPLFYLIVFSIRQYNKERKLLEIYTHKRVIAQALPAYIEQANQDDVKNEILLRGSTMIFTLPENPETPIQGMDGIAMNELKGMLDIKSKITNG